jgi:hypothetical protein
VKNYIRNLICHTLYDFKTKEDVSITVSSVHPTFTLVKNSTIYNRYFIKSKNDKSNNHSLTLIVDLMKETPFIYLYRIKCSEGSLNEEIINNIKEKTGANCIIKGSDLLIQNEEEFSSFSLERILQIYNLINEPYIKPLTINYSEQTNK